MIRQATSKFPLRSKGRIASIVSMCFFLVVFLPPVADTRYSYIMFLLLYFIVNKWKITLPKTSLFLLLLVMAISEYKALISTNHFRESIVSIIYMITPLSAFYVGCEFSKTGNNRQKRLLFGIVAAELIICFAQITNRGIGLFLASIYTIGEKYINMYLFTNSARAMGTFGNGNYVGFFFLVSQIIVLEFYKKEKRKGYLMFWLLLSAGIISTGSRTALLFSLFYFFLIANTATIKRLLKVSKPLYVGYLLMIVIVGAIVIVYRYEILSFVSSVANRESSVDKSTFALRYEVWQNFSLDTNDFSILLFGNRITGERTTLDNLFLYSLFRYGIIGTIIQLFVYTTALYLEGKVTRNTSLSRNCMMILYLSGFIADYWFNPFFGSLYLFLIGYAFHISNDKRKRNMGVDRLTNIRTSMSMIE